MKKIRIAIVGYGGMGSKHPKIMDGNEMVECAGAYDIKPERMEVARQDGFHTYESMEALLSDPTVDVVTVAIPNDQHKDVCIQCMRAGKNVVCEKPVSLSSKELEEMIAVSKECGVRLCVNHQLRFGSTVRALKREVEAGHFGKLLHGTVQVRRNRNKAYFDAGKWRGTWAQDGGTLMNQCIHYTDLLQWFMGSEVTEVFAYTDRLTHPYIEAEDLGLALVKFANGAYGIIEGTTNIYPHNLEETLYLFGQDGTVKAGGKSVNIIEEWDFRDGRGDPAAIKQHYCENPPNVYGYGHTPLYADVIDAVVNDRAPYVDGYAGMRALELILAIYKSAAEHRPVQLPLQDCATTDFEGRFGR